MDIHSNDLLKLLAALSASFNMQDQSQKDPEPANAEDVIEGVHEVLSEAAAYPDQSGGTHQILALTIPDCLTTDELLDELLDLLEEYGIEDHTWLYVNGAHWPRDAKDALMFALHKTIRSATDGKGGREDLHMGFNNSIALTFQDISNIRSWTEMYNTGIKRLTINGLTITL